MLLDHLLSRETLALMGQAVETIGGRLAIYTAHSWAIEMPDRPDSLAFDPMEDTPFLRDELRRMIVQGTVIHP